MNEEALHIRNSARELLDDLYEIILEYESENYNAFKNKNTIYPIVSIVKNSLEEIKDKINIAMINTG